MDWLFEGNWLVYAALVALAAACLGLYVNDRKPRWLGLMLVPLLIAAAYFALDRAVETKAEQIGRKLRAMAGAVEHQEAATIASHLAASFRYGGRDKAAFRKFTEGFLRERRVNSLTVWDVAIDGDAVTLKAKPHGGMATGAEYFFVKTTWAHEGDGQWRLAGFTVHNPYADSQTPLDVTTVK